MIVKFERQDMYHFYCKKWEQDFFIYLTDCEGSLTKKWNVFQLGPDGYDQLNSGDGFDTSAEAIEYATKQIEEWDRMDRENGVS